MIKPSQKLCLIATSVPTEDRAAAFLGQKASGSAMMSHHAFARWVVESNVRSRKAVLAAAKNNESVFQYVCKYQNELEQKVAFAWELHDAPQEVERDSMSNWDCVLAARESPCICNQRWIPLTEELLSKQEAAFRGDLLQERPSVPAIRAVHVKCLTLGRGKYNNVYCYGPRNCGKSHTIDPVIALRLSGTSVSFSVS